MPSDLSSVIEEFELDDAELVVVALRDTAESWRRIAPKDSKQLVLIANHLAMELGKVRRKAERPQPTPDPTSGYMAFDASPDAQAAKQQLK